MNALNLLYNSPAENHQAVLGEQVRDDDADGATTATYDVSVSKCNFYKIISDLVAI